MFSRSWLRMARKLLNNNWLDGLWEEGANWMEQLFLIGKSN